MHVQANVAAQLKVMSCSPNGNPPIPADSNGTNSCSKRLCLCCLGRGDRLEFFLVLGQPHPLLRNDEVETSYVRCSIGACENRCRVASTLRRLTQRRGAKAFP